MSTSGTRRNRATTVEQLLDREEALALQRISTAVQNVGEGLLAATDLRGSIRRHPFLTAGLGVCLGFVGGPFVLRTFKRVLGASSRIPIPGAGPLHDFPGLVLASLWGSRGRK